MMTEMTLQKSFLRKCQHSGWIAFACVSSGLSILLAADPGNIVMPQPAAHWRVEYELPAREVDSAWSEEIKSLFAEVKHLQSIEYKVFENTAEIKTIYEGGTEETSYLLGDYVYRYDGRSKKPIIEAVIEDNLRDQCRRLYPEFSFPFQKFYVETVEAFDQMCFYYRSDLDDPSDETWEGWASVETGRPIAFRHGKVFAKFKFLTSPNAPVVLPEVFVDLGRSTFKQSPSPGSMAGKKR